MAVQVISSQTFTQGLTANHSVTVPVDCEMVVVLFAGYAGFDTVPAVTKLNFDGAGVDFTHIGSGTYNTRPIVEAYYLLSPPTGAQTLESEMPSDDEGWTVEVVYLKGVDTGNPIGDTAATATSGEEGPTTVDISLPNVGGGDLAMVVGYSYQQAPDADPAGYGQTSLEESVYNNAGIGVGYEVGETSLRLGNLSYHQYVAFAVNGTGAASSAVAQIMMTMNQFSGGL